MSIIIVFGLSLGIEEINNNIKNNTYKVEENSKQKNIKEENTSFIAEKNNQKEVNEIENQESNHKEDQNQIEENEFDWYIEIPKIKLYAPIEEGTDDEILNRSVGHFENTSRRNGNCGLAAHNRGFRVNYFAKVKELEKGDNVFYFVDDKKYKYEVAEIAIIYETDWSLLENTEENKLTLITCIENREEYRLCVQCNLIE